MIIKNNNETKEKDDQPKDDLLQNKLSELLSQESEMRTIGLMGDVTEEKSSELIMGLLLLTKLSGEPSPWKPITMYISTYGGSADEMFGMYDMMTHLKSQCEIHTIGIGKVMSAGTLILAAGTKGKRLIGRNCRVMIHSVNAGQAGDLHNIENEVKAVKHMQDLYINAMSAETHMTKRQIQKLIDRKINVYLSAQEAIEYGIADDFL